MAWSLYISITWGQCWWRFQRPCRWQWLLWLLRSSEAKIAWILLSFFGLWKEVPVEEISLGQIFCACILSGIRTGVLELGTHRTTTTSGSLSTGVLGMSVVLVLWGTDMYRPPMELFQLSRSWSSNLVLRDVDVAVVETRRWHGAAVAWFKGTGYTSITSWGKVGQVKLWPQESSCRKAAAWFWW